MTTGTEFIQKVSETIRRHAMLAGGETVLVGVSGGADSVALLHLLLSLAPEWALSLHLLHLHHGLRPESDREAEFVEELARSWSVPISIERLQGLSLQSPSLEAEARKARYEVFRRWSERFGAQRIALGHTGDDQAETVLMRLLEGAGPRGLSGIPPVRGRFIRPLIEQTRDEILDYCRANQLAWIEDPSNADPKFLRNRLRHELLPLLASAYNPNISEALRRVGRRSREAVESLRLLAEREFNRMAQVESDSITLQLEELRQSPPGLIPELLRLAMRHLDLLRPFREHHYRAFRNFVERQSPSGELRLGELLIERGPTQLRLSRSVESELPELLLPVPGSVDLPSINLRIEARVLQNSFSSPPLTLPLPLRGRGRVRGYQEREGRVRGTESSVVFDAEGLPDHLTVRGRKPGDRFTPFGAPGSKSLKKFLIDQRIPRWKRDQIPIVLAGDEILWLVGLRRSDGHRVTSATQRIVELRFAYLTTLLNPQTIA